jgi:HicA toxin of bacterial toxin-antitoxin,
MMSVITYMSQSDRFLLRILRGTSDANIPFEGLCQLLRRLGFDERIRGSHHIFTKEGVEEILNLQPQGRQAKPYQVKQVRGVLLKYHLGGRADER